MKNKAWTLSHSHSNPKRYQWQAKCGSANVPEDAPFLYYLLLQLNKLLCKFFPSQAACYPLQLKGSSPLSPSLSGFLSELSKYLLCSTSQLPPQKLSLRKMKNPLQEAPCPSSQTALQNLSQSSMGSLLLPSTFSSHQKPSEKKISNDFLSLSAETATKSLSPNPSLSQLKESSLFFLSQLSLEWKLSWTP